MRAGTTVDPGTRERILDVGFALFAEAGFAGATVTEIERRAGLSPGSGSFYRHFRSKEDLLPLAVERQVDRTMAEIVEAHAALPAISDPVAQRAAWLAAVFEHVQRFDPLIRLMLADGHRVPEIRDAITSALRRTGEQLSWEEHPVLVVCLAAVAGYHLMSEVVGRPFQGADQDEFVQLLANLTA